jgi:anti-anti-sigma factor
MTIHSERNSKTSMQLSISGRLDTASSPQLERKIKQIGNDITDLTLDFMELSYISSMGLRVLLQPQKTMKENGRRLVIKNMKDTIREVFEMTGFINLMVQEEKFVVVRKDEPPNRVILSFNGKMDVENVPVLEKEFLELRETNAMKDDITNVVLNVEKLSSLSSEGCQGLREALEKTAWDKIKTSIENASADIRTVCETGGLGSLFEA